MGWLGLAGWPDLWGGPLDRDDQSAKFWLGPVALARNLGSSAQELRRIERMIRNYEGELLEAWRGYFEFETR